MVEDNEEPVEIKHKNMAGGVWVENWFKSSYYCPSCGTQKVFNGSSDDYYAGVQFLCINCNHNFYFYQEPHEVKREVEKNIIHHLKNW